MIYDTYVSTMRCPECGEVVDVSVEDTRGNNEMRTIRPLDCVTEFRPKRFIEIVNEGDCEECGCSFEVHIPIVHGLVGEFSHSGFSHDHWDDDRRVIDFLSCIADGASVVRGKMQRKMSVVEMIFRFWITSHDGGDIPSEWHVSEDGLPVIGADTDAVNLIRAISQYLNDGVH